MTTSLHERLILRGVGYSTAAVCTEVAPSRVVRIFGYKNAHFGPIEAHESVTAYSREILLQAKESAEAAGFQLLHAIVDSLWLHKPGARRAD